MALRTLLAQAQQRLAAVLDLPADEVRIEAQILLREALGRVSRAWLLTHDNDQPTPEQQKAFASLLERRLAGEPVAYILGRREFFGLDFTLTPDVLIPRPDTETLVEAALSLIPDGVPWRVLDLGTGSGAIAIAIASQRPLAAVTAVERSETALAVARSNAVRLLAPSPQPCPVKGEMVGNLRLRCSDWFSSLAGEMFDLIVSNPPYIAEADAHLDAGDLRFEPRSALASGSDGLDDIKRIVNAAPAHLQPGGWLLLEHGHDQAEWVATLLGEAGFVGIHHASDLAGIRRVTQGRKP